MRQAAGTLVDLDARADDRLLGIDEIAPREGHSNSVTRVTAALPQHPGEPKYFRSIRRIPISPFVVVV